MAVNDPAENTFGGLTAQLQQFGRIDLSNAGGMIQIKRNGDLNQSLDINKKILVILAHFISCQKMRESLITVSLTDTKSTVKFDNESLGCFQIRFDLHCGNKSHLCVK